ncbi:MAG: hypothetical protein ACLUOI_30450, partial [Eisenbergiella sp.]
DPNSRFEDLDRLFPFSDYCNLALGEERIQMAAPLELGPCNWPYLTVLRRIPLYGDVEEMRGYFAVAFEPDVLWEKISGSFQFQGSLLIMDETGKLILSNMPDSPETVHIQEILNENFFKNDETYYDFHVGGIKYDVTSLISGCGLRYISDSYKDAGCGQYCREPDGAAYFGGADGAFLLYNKADIRKNV